MKIRKKFTTDKTNKTKIQVYEQLKYKKLKERFCAWPVKLCCCSTAAAAALQLLLKAPQEDPNLSRFLLPAGAARHRATLTTSHI